jgi:hypothetical protein
MAYARRAAPELLSPNRPQIASPLLQLIEKPVGASQQQQQQQQQQMPRPKWFFHKDRQPVQYKSGKQVVPPKGLPPTKMDAKAADKHPDWRCENYTDEGAIHGCQWADGFDPALGLEYL